MYAILYFDRLEYRQRFVGGYNSDGTINIKRFDALKDAERYMTDWPEGTYHGKIVRHNGPWVTGWEG